MAKPTTYATQICIAVTMLAAIGIGLGLLTGHVLYPVILLLPAAGYAVYRTEGASTMWASWAMAILLLSMIVLVVFDISYDIRRLFGESATVGGRRVPLGDIKTVWPAMMAACAIILYTRTRGRYTKWLAAVVAVGAAFIVYTVSPEAVGDLFGDLLNRI